LPGNWTFTLCEYGEKKRGAGREVAKTKQRFDQRMERGC
jgi:hypothetical protein